MALIDTETGKRIYTPEDIPKPKPVRRAKSAVVPLASRTLIVEADGKNFEVVLPGFAKVTFGPFSPSKGYSADGNRGTLRVYGKTKDDMLALFTGVISFRDASQVTTVTTWVDPATVPLDPSDVPF